MGHLCARSLVASIGRALADEDSGISTVIPRRPVRVWNACGGDYTCDNNTPIISSISRDVLRAIPNSQREAALALGATKWEATKIILAGGRSGLFGATLLGLGRAVGETMAVTMVIGNRPEVSYSLLDPGYSMASVIANEFAEATTNLYTSSLIEIALLLFVVTILLNALARFIVWSVTKKFKTA